MRLLDVVAERLELLGRRRHGGATVRRAAPTSRGARSMAPMRRRPGARPTSLANGRGGGAAE